MDRMLMLYITLGAIVGYAVRIGAGTLAEHRRRSAETRQAQQTDLESMQRRVTALTDHYRELEQLVGSMQQLVKASAPAALVDLGERLAKVEARDAQMHLAVMDQAEKVSRRLQDRERKRSAPELSDDEAVTDPDLLLALGKRQYPLFPGDVRPEGMPE